jgi:anti-anti-sigma factor
MEIKRSVEGPVVILEIHGPMIEDDAEGFQAALDKCAEMNSFRLVLEVSQVPFMDSCILEKIQHCANNFSKRGGRVCIASPDEVCHDILIATRLNNFVPTLANRDEAIRSLL